MLASIKSIRRFISLWIGINDPCEVYHQTLTFPSIEHDYSQAKRYLEKLLDNIHHRFEVASLSVVGIHGSSGFHFHVVFLFFRPVTDSEEKRFKKALWEAWKGLHGGSLARKANEFHKRTTHFKDRIYTLNYFTKEITAFPRHWWGQRNIRLLKKHSKSVSSREISAVFEKLDCFQWVKPIANRNEKRVCDLHDPHDILL